MDGNKYNVAVSIFFPPYILAEVPSNILLGKFRRPSTYMGIIILAWGVVMTLTGIVRDYGGFCATRVLLGLFEYVPTMKRVLRSECR